MVKRGQEGCKGPVRQPKQGSSCIPNTPSKNLHNFLDGIYLTGNIMLSSNRLQGT